MSNEWHVERGKIWEFARACLNNSDAYNADDAVAPPTFPRTISFWTQPNRGEQRGRERMDMRRVLHGEQEFEYIRPLRAGDVLTTTSEVKDTYEKEGKRGGTMQFVVTETTFKDQNGEVVAYARGTTIQTGKPATS
jgi:hydroxyacyl-ACP dehydratase HTD2-like protein with hotdog domain